MVTSIDQPKTEQAIEVPPPTGEQHRILAAIDIGTNSIHMVVVRIQPELPAFNIIAREKDTVRLGARDPETGSLTQNAMQRGLAALQRCQDLAESFNAEQIVAVATSAVRESPNGREFLKRIDSELDLFVNILSGQEEARRIYLGVLSGMEFNNQPHVIIDIGGGSTELILGDSRQARFLSSTKVGTVRLTNEFVTTDPISDKEFQYLQAFVRERLERPIEELRTQLASDEHPRIVGTSGTIECLATIHAQEKLKSSPNPLQGYQLPRKDLKNIVKRLASLSEKERADVPGMSAKRAEIIVPGAMILHETMEMLDLDAITICERALREGVVVDWMLTHGFIEDRLRYQGSVRRRSVLNIAQKYQVNMDYSNRVANFAVSLFDQTQGIFHNWGSEERELLWAAAILHKCGVYVSHAQHHKHSYYLIRNGELLGFSETEVEAIANLARYHRKSKPKKKKHDNYNNLPNKKYRQLVSQLSALLRLAVAVDRRLGGAVEQVRCEYHSDEQQLHLHLTPTNPNDDCALELWSLEDKKVVFEEEYGVKVVATVEAATVAAS